MENIVTTAASIIHNEKKFLVCHVTNANYWSVPKGIIEEKETPRNACLRETLEETGIDILELAGHVYDLGEHEYYKGKNIHFFEIHVTKLPEIKDMMCESQVELVGRTPFPEVDRYEYIKFEVHEQYLNKNQSKIFSEIMERLHRG